MYNVYGVPRINALGLKGPEKSPNLILENIKYKEIRIENDNIAEDENRIFVEANKAMKGKALFVGGDHSITYPIARAFMLQKGRDDSFLIVFDAHADCMPATPEPTHEEVFYGLVKQAKWVRENIALVGLRKIEREEKDFLEDEKIRHWDWRHEKNEVLMDLFQIAKGKKVYVSVDIDVLNPKIAPGVSYNEKGGMSKELLLYYIENIKNNLDVHAWDVVEYVPQNDKKEITLNTIKEIVALILRE